MLGNSSEHILPNGGFDGDESIGTIGKKSPTKLTNSKNMGPILKSLLLTAGFVPKRVGYNVP